LKIQFGLSKFELEIRRNKRADVNTIQKNISVKSNFSYILSKRLIWIWRVIGLEAFIWIIGMVYLAFRPISYSTHFTVCPLNNLGFDFCPGCGLGNSISLLITGDFMASFYSHPLGTFAFTIIIARIISVIINNRRRYA